MTPLKRAELILPAVALLFITGYIGLTRERGGSALENSATLELITTQTSAIIAFEKRVLSGFAAEHKMRLELSPPSITVVRELPWLQEHLKSHSPKPDIYEIDVIWPAALAADLVDLAPFYRRSRQDLDPAVLHNFFIGQRLVALPSSIDVGVLYYRDDLLTKYGYREPPSTWDQLTAMAKRIQAGERSQGKANFWGYVWQGGAYEGLTCDALEWQASEGGPNFLDESGFAHVNNPQMLNVLKRAVSWIGSISPPGEAFYTEPDSINLFNEGNAAFMRNWVSFHDAIRQGNWSANAKFNMAPLPGGPGGQRGALGGSGLSVSLYSKNRPVAIEALLKLTGTDAEKERAYASGTIPVNKALRDDPAIIAKTSLRSQEANQILAGLISRGVLGAGSVYLDASEAYFLSINSVLAGTSTPEEAMPRLEAQLVAIREKEKAAR